MRLKQSESSEPSASSPRAWCTLNISFRLHILISSVLISSGEHAHISRAVLGFFQDQETRCIIRPLVCPQSSDTNSSWTPLQPFDFLPHSIVLTKPHLLILLVPLSLAATFLKTSTAASTLRGRYCRGLLCVVGSSHVVLVVHCTTLELLHVQCAVW